MNLLDDSGNESRGADSGLGKIPTTRVRRRICLFRFSNPLLVRMRGQLEGSSPSSRLTLGCNHGMVWLWPEASLQLHCRTGH